MTPANIAALQNLIQTDPALEAQMESATTLEAAAQLLTQAAQAKGISVDMAVISAYLKAAMDAPLTDAELETVAGGGAMSDALFRRIRFNPNRRRAKFFGLKI